MLKAGLAKDIIAGLAEDIIDPTELGVVVDGKEEEFVGGAVVSSATILHSQPDPKPRLTLLQHNPRRLFTHLQAVLLHSRLSAAVLTG